LSIEEEDKLQISENQDFGSEKFKFGEFDLRMVVKGGLLAICRTRT